MDRGGKLAAKGTVDSALLATLLTHPFFRQRPPKSTGREEFGKSFLTRLHSAARRRHLTPEDMLATASLLTAMVLGGARRWLPGAVDEVLVGGGGVRNRTLMADLAAVFSPIPVRTFDEAGWESKAFEAVAFAALAYQTIQGECANVPAATGAAHPVVLGTIVPGGPGWQDRLGLTRLQGPRRSR
ncbi:MAG: hypothetical protein FJ246_02100 [Nitrospira sp.]|nr:hypothetical protein [Nitrospira sp.]